MAPCSLFDKYQGFGGTCSIHLHSGRPENVCSRFLRNISASPTHCCLSTTTYVAVEWYSRYSVQISAQKTAVIAKMPVGFRTPFKNMLETYVKLRHDRYVHVLSNLVTRWKQLTESLYTPKYRSLIFSPWQPSQTDARYTPRCVLCEIAALLWRMKTFLVYDAVSAGSQRRFGRTWHPHLQGSPWTILKTDGEQLMRSQVFMHAAMFLCHQRQQATSGTFWHVSGREQTNCTK